MNQRKRIRHAGASDSEPKSSRPISSASGTVRDGVWWRLGGVVQTVRPHQWVKNVFVLAPVVFSRGMFIDDLLIRSVGAFSVFCLLAGAVYTMNDLADREADAAHPVKRHRAIASGRLPLSWARPLVVVLVVLGLLGAAVGPWEFLATAAVYFLQNIAYSFWLKRVAYLDVVIIASGFVLRVMAGGFATHTQLSGYLLSCTALLALFLGFGKRRHELSAVSSGQRQRKALEGYTARGVRRALHVTAALTVACYVAYTFDPATVAFFGDRSLWWTSIFVILGVLRFIQLVGARPKAESPTQEMLRDGPFVAIVFSWVMVVLWVVYNLRPSS